MTTLEFQEKKRLKKKISMLTCYDSSFAQILNESLVDALLVGDSAAMVMHGFNTTIPATLEMMVLHTAAVARSCPKKLIVADLPFMSFRKDLKSNVEAADSLMRAGAHAVKLEGVLGNETLIEHLVQSGVPVMGHLGLTPQFVNVLGGFKVQGRDEQAQVLIYGQAQKLQQLGAFSVVLECVPAFLAKKISENLNIPVIGIGAGLDVDGQILVLHDVLGFSKTFRPKFVRKYFDAYENFGKIFDQFHKDVEDGQFPNESESFTK